MKLAGKYSICSASKDDGGNLGWLEVGWNKNDPRQPRGGFKSLSNEELNDFIMKGVDEMTLNKGEVFGPVETYEGFHLAFLPGSQTEPDSLAEAVSCSASSSMKL